MKVKRRKVSKSNPEEVEISAEPDFEADVVVLQVGDQEVLLRAEDAADLADQISDATLELEEGAAVVDEEEEEE